MKRKLVTLLLALCSVFTLGAITACGNTNGDDLGLQNPIESSSEEEVFSNSWTDTSLEEVHIHIFETTNDEDYHWTECACGEGTEKIEHLYTERQNDEYHWEECDCGAQKNTAMHNYTEGNHYDDNYHWAECSCGKKINIVAHSYVENCDADNHWEECSCGIKINVNVHSYKLEKYNEKYHLEICSCGKKETVEHIFENNKCSCGYHFATEGLAYTLSDDRTYYSVAKGTATDIDIIIPAVYEDLPVKELKWGAFKEFNTLKSIVIPNSITSIGGSAFYNCNKLETVNIPNSVNSIGSAAFENCYILKEITIPGSVKYLDSHVFSACNLLSKVTIEEGVTVIGSAAFQACFALKEINIPDSVNSINQHAFALCDGLQKITIGTGVNFIDGDAFVNCSGISSVVFKNTTGWKADNTEIVPADLANTSTAATYLKTKYVGYTWTRSDE